MDERRQTLPRAARLRSRRDFLRVQRRGRSVETARLVVILLENDLPHRRLGVTVSSRVGNAVARARVKRWLREVFRRNRTALPASVDAVLIARRPCVEAGQAALERDFLSAAAQLSEARA